MDREAGVGWPRRCARTALAIVWVTALVAPAIATSAEDVGPWPTDGWQTSSPEAQGMSSAALAALVDLGVANDMDSLLVVRHGRVLVDAYYAPFRPGMRHLVNSVTKAVVGTLAGIAVQAGEIASLDEPVLESFRWRAVADPDGRKAKIRIGDLLDMTSGLDWTEPLTAAVPETMLQMERSADWVGFVLDRPMAHAPGTTFNYNSGDWQLASAILARKTGADVLAYAQRTLFAPLGIADATWRSDPQGVRSGGFGLSLQPRDMAKIGYLLLHHGEWAGRRIVPRAWTDRIFAAPVDMRLGSTPALRYAYGWWAIPDRRAYLAVGFLRQLVIVLPDADVVAVVTGKRNYPILPLIDKLAAAAAAKSPLPEDADGQARLAERVRAAAVEKATPVGPASPLAAAISGRVWRFDRNLAGLRSMQLDLGATEPRYRVELEGRGGTRRLDGPIGLDGLSRSQDIGDGQWLAVKGRWIADDTFEITSQWVTDGAVTTTRLAFRDREVDATIAGNAGWSFRARGVAAE